MLFFWFSSSGIAAATYTVSKTADTNDGTCDADCSLREAITAANAGGGADTIDFNIPTSDPNWNTSSFPGAFRLPLSSLMSISISEYLEINGLSQTQFTGDTSVSDLANYTTGPEIIIDDQNSGFTSLHFSGGAKISHIGLVNHGGGSRPFNFGAGSVAVEVTNNTFTNKDINRDDNTGILRFYGTFTGTVNISDNVFYKIVSPNRQSDSIVKFFAGTYGGTIANNLFDDENTKMMMFYGAGLTTNVLEINNNQFYNSYRIDLFTTNTRDYIHDNVFYNFKEQVLSVSNGNANHISNNKFFGSIKTPIDLISSGDDLALITPNDLGDADTGANELMNWPQTTSVEYRGGNNFKIKGVIDFNSAETPITIEIFKSDDHSSGHGGSSAYLSSVVPNSSGEWEASFDMAGEDCGRKVTFTTTATNVNGSTSEFGNNFSVCEHFSTPSQPDYLGGAPLPITVVEKGDVLSLVPAGAFKWDAYLSVVETSKTGSFRLPGTLYWQATSKYEVWWRAFSNNAQIVSTEVAKPFTLAFNYLPEAFEKNLSERNLKLAFSPDGKKWQILPRTILNTKNNTISVVTKTGGYYMLVSGYYPLGLMTTEFDFATSSPASEQQTQIQEERKEVVSEPKKISIASQQLGRNKIITITLATMVFAGGFFVFLGKRRKNR